MDNIVELVPADDAETMLKDAFCEAGYPAGRVNLEKGRRAIAGDGKTIVHGEVEVRFLKDDDPERYLPESTFDFEINAGTHDGDVILGELEVVIYGGEGR